MELRSIQWSILLNNGGSWPRIRKRHPNKTKQYHQYFHLLLRIQCPIFFIIHSFTFRYLHHFHLHSNSVIVFYCNSFKQIISASTIATSWIFSSWAIFPFYCYTCTCSVESDNYEAPQPDQTWLSNISRCFHSKPTTLTIATPSLRLSSLSNVHSSSWMTPASQFHAQ